MKTVLTNTFGIAARNFTAYPEMPDAKALVDYGVRVEELGFDSLWVWDHILLGVEPNFPIIDSLTMLTAIAARTSKIKLGTGILVLPLRNPVVLAKQLVEHGSALGRAAALGMASGWYKREFDAVGIPFEKRGKIMDENLEILRRLWTEEQVNGSYMSHHHFQAAVMYPKPTAAAHADPDRRLCRPRAPARRRGRRRLAHLFLPAAGLHEILGQDACRRRGGRQGPGQAYSTPRSCRSWSAPRARRCARR